MQKSILYGFAFIVAFACVGMSQGGPVNESYAARVQLALAKAWPQMSQIWPGADYSKMYLLLTNGSDYWAIDSQGIEKLPYAEAPESIRINQSSGFFFAKATYKGQPAMAVHSVEDNFLVADKVPFVFSLATHEAFHLYVQPLWSVQLPSMATRTSRATTYPSNVTPRLYRRLIFEEMLTATTLIEALGTAKYWLERWKEEFPAESGQIIYNDIVEGTAKYVEIMADVYAIMEPRSSAEQIKAAALKLIKEQLDQFAFFGSLDSESYPLGSLAGWLLDKVQPSWKDGFSTDPHTLLDLLLDKVQPTKQDPPQNHWINDIVSLRQKADAAILEPFIADWKDTSKVLVALPEQMKSSFNTSGFFSVSAVGGNIIANIVVELGWAGGSAVLTNLTVLEERVSACGEASYLVFPLASQNFTLSGNKVTINLPTIKGEFTGSLVENNGRTYLCAQ